MSGPTTDRSGRIQKPDGQGEAPQQQSLLRLLRSPELKGEIERALPNHLTADRMLRILTTSLRTVEHLAECSPPSFLGCVLQASQLGLEVNTPLQHAFLIPRRNKHANNRYECTLIIGYQGQLELSLRSGRVAGISAMVVKEGDYFEHEYGLTPKLRHRMSPDPDREDRPITHAWACGEIKGGGQPFVVLSLAQIEARRSRSAASGSGPWVTDYEAMATKTALRALWKFLPKSSEMARAETLEAAVESGRSQISAIDEGIQERLLAMGLQDADEDQVTS